MLILLPLWGDMSAHIDAVGLSVARAATILTQEGNYSRTSTMAKLYTKLPSRLPPQAVDLRTHGTFGWDIQRKNSGTPTDVVHNCRMTTCTARQ